MKRFMILIALQALLIAAEYYKLTGVRRIGDNMYKADGNLIIETRYCYAYAYGDDALLKWYGPNSWDNKIVFEDDDETCDVKGIYRSR